MVSKKQEFALGVFGLGTVVIAFIAILMQSYNLSLVAAFLAIITMIMTIAFVYTEDEKLQMEIESLAKEKRSRRFRK